MRHLFAHQNGRVCCAVHLGHYGVSALAVQPDVAWIDTPLGTWVRMSFLDVQEWEAFAEELGRDACEGCASF